MPQSRMPAPPTRPEPRLQEPEPRQPDPERPNRKWTLALGGLVLVFAVLAAYDLVANGGVLTLKPVASSSTPRSASPSAQPSRSVLAAPNGVSPTASASPSRPSASASPSVSPSATLGAVRELSVVSATAFGPAGTSNGDNPDLASRVLAGDGVNAWTTSWYKTPEFGNLQAGTGLLLDMGHVVSVSSVRVVLGQSVGADLQLRLGDTADSLADLTTAARASDVGGTVHLPLSSPERARYILIWFTRLPPNPDGNYQVMIYSVRVNGRK